VEETRARAKENADKASLFFDEGAAGTYLNDIGPTQARDMAAALGIVLREARQQNAVELPVVIVVGDGRPLVPELVAAVAEGLRWSGCHVVDIGQASAPATAFAVKNLETDGGILVGNPGYEPQIVGLKFWGAQGMPLSTDQIAPSLDDVRRVYESRPARPCRKFGSLRRLQIEDAYLATLADHYHALRPLRVVLDCGCRPMVEYLRRLTGALPCEILNYRAGESSCSSTQGQLVSPVACDRYEQSEPQQPVAGDWANRTALQYAVRKNGAHLAVSVDGNGETCTVFDERGRTIEAQRLAELIGRHVEGQIDDGDGRLAYANAGVPLPDALRTLTLLLEILSQSDRPLSSVLDESRAGG
ncbi:MAG: hypothetical protein JXM70_11610, partial [Pirellulales bacterium]|nr:hypothetical protein [Pirellulales bacterium]